MNLILCDKDCVNQIDGYCNLAGITSVKGTTEKGCLYYQKGSPESAQSSSTAHILKSLGNGTNSN